MEPARHARGLNPYPPEARADLTAGPLRRSAASPVVRLMVNTLVGDGEDRLALAGTTRPG